MKEVVKNILRTLIPILSVVFLITSLADLSSYVNKHSIVFSVLGGYYLIPLVEGWLRDRLK